MRALVVGGSSERALALTAALTAEGHAVRAVARTEDRRARLEDAGAQCWIGTPDRIGTIRNALDNVTVVLWLLGTAEGPAELVSPLHGSRLKMMLEKVTDTTVRGFVYEGAGPLDPACYAAGLAEVEWANRMNEIPYRVLSSDPRGPLEPWLAEARSAVDSLLGARRA